MNKSLYAHDPDGIEFEVMWLTPPELWGDEEQQAIVRPLDIAGDIEKYGRDRASTTHVPATERSAGVRTGAES